MRERAGRAGQPDRRGDDVERGAAVDAADRHDGGIQGRDLPRDDRLEGLDDAGGGDDRVGGLVRRCAVAPAPLDLDRELVHGGHQRAAVDADLSDRKLVPEVKAEGRGDPFQDAVATQASAPPAPSSAG